MTTISAAKMMTATMPVMARGGAQATTLSRVLASAGGPVGIRGGQENMSMGGLGTFRSGVFCCTAGSPVIVEPVRRLRRCGSASCVVR